MTTQVVIGFAKTQSSSFPLKTTITDNTDSQELKTNDTFTVTSQSLGTIGEGQVLTHLSVTAATGLCYAAVLRNGQLVAMSQSLGSYAYGGQPKYLPIVPAPLRLVAGDQIIVRTEA
jgi:hypothetical protein